MKQDNLNRNGKQINGNVTNGAHVNGKSEKEASSLDYKLPNSKRVYVKGKMFEDIKY